MSKVNSNFIKASRTTDRTAGQSS